MIYRYSSSCELNSEHIPLHVCPASEFFGTDRLVGAIVSGIAFDPVAKDLYAVDNKGQQLTAFSTVTIPDATTAKATNLTAVDARLNGTVNPSGVALSECLFEWGEAGQPFEHTAPCASPNASEVGSGEVPVAVHADISGLTATKTYHFRLVVSNANTDLAEEPSRGAEVVFGPPKVTASVSAVSATDATLGAQINPQNVATTFHFEYTTQADFEANGFGNATKSPTPDAPAGAGDEEVDRSAPIGGLASNTTYRYRLIAENSVGTAVESPALAFTTQGPATVGLPDARGYELVSPPNKHGAPIEAIPLEGGVIQAAADGSAIAYFAKAPALEEPAGSRSAMNSQLLSARAPAGGWSTADVSTPHQGASGVIPGDLSEYKLFSTDLSRGVVEPFGGTPLSPLTTEKTPYLRQPGGEYTPLVTAANVPAGVKFGGKEGSPEAFGGDVNFITASPDLAHILFTSIQPLTEDFKAGFKPAAANVYEWSGGALQLVSFVPSGTATACGDSGPACKPAAEAGAAALAGAHNYQLRGAISTDGSRVVFETGASRLYQRDLARGETVQLDAAEPACLAQHKCESGGGQFQYASTDGSRVFFTDGRRLTADSAPTSSSGATPDLYMCQIEVKGEEHLACTLTDLTANTVNPSEPANVSGAVLGGAEDGSSVYFVAQGALTEGEGAVHGNCTSSGGVGSGECNLYRYDTATEATSLVAVLSGADRNDWFAAGGIDLGQLTARVSPNGRYLAFMSSQPLTGYDNRDAKTGVRDQEVFLYDSGAEALRCASCDPSGARPHGVLDETPYPHLLVDRPDNWLGQTLAANVPGWTRVNLGYAVYQSRYLSNAGRLFFNAADSLVPADTNGNFDVYQFEFPQGEGQPASNTCTTASATYSPATGGCVSLVSSGTSPEESAFVDASESGNDVFFLTASRLTSRDVDGALDLYDARSGGGEAEAVKPIECSGDACQQPAVPPSDPTPGSLTFQGAGNLLECSKSKVKKSGKCVARKAKKKHHKKNKRTAAHNRGGQK
ncbi:MAG TPA: hypothetical protein VGO13_12790 [Solirubrobacterales bacterium]|nr:hypothetical protein [Solirubrobacterales bacterium]